MSNWSPETLSPNMNDELYLTRLSLDTRRLLALSGAAKNQGQYDMDYAVHALLTALFDPDVPSEERQAPKPFAVVGQEGPQVDLLGYTRLDGGALLERAAQFGDPLAVRALRQETLASRPVPQFPSGTHLRFSIRACPTKRTKSKADPTRSVELDSFLVGAHNESERAQVYEDWLRVEFLRHGGCVAHAVEVRRMLRRQFLRKSQGVQRTATKPTLPDVAFSGVLTVADCDLFRRYLARGVGRHRAFGFGMLLLAPAGASKQ